MAKSNGKKPAKSAAGKVAKGYTHPDQTLLMRPEVGTQAQFKKKLPPKKYRYDDSLSPALDWDGQNPAREQGEGLIRQALEAKTLEEAKTAASKLKAMSKPFLNWAGKAERLSFEVPTLPLFIHERLSTKAILETLKGHRFDRNQETMFDLWGDPQHSVADQVLRAYEHKDKWVNRMVLGDSLVVMNSLLHYEGLGGQVQMIYIDPPYGIKFGSNFQPFVRRRDVTHNDDEDMTREPETVQAYRDTWELGLHSYLNYLRDRLLLARQLLHSSGSVFVQISDENLHHVRELLDEVFGREHHCGLIAFRTTGGQSSALISVSTDFLLWYAKDKDRAKEKFRNPTLPKYGGTDASGQYSWIEPRDYSEPPRRMTTEELNNPELIPANWRMLRPDNLYGQGSPSDPSEHEFVFERQTFRCPPSNHWKPGVKSGGMQRLADAKRLMVVGNTLSYKRYVEDFPVYLMDNVWNDTAISGFGRKKEYAVETSPKVIERCILMTTAPGDLVLDPTCGSGTTAYCAEQWGRRWVTIDTSRVPLALARQRLLTATFVNSG
jgi:adenine-specific DNA-methyltransferase